MDRIGAGTIAVIFVSRRTRADPAGYAAAGRDDPRHGEIRADGRARWYASYAVHVATIDRSYRWAAPAAPATDGGPA